VIKVWRAGWRGTAFGVCAAGVGFGVLATLLLCGSGMAGASTPTLTVTPSTDLHDGESVSVSIGPNTVFTPHSRLNILECSDPGGSVANFPKDDSTCDGNTIQGQTMLVAANGSASDSDYTIYLLPSTALGEQSNNQPICNATNPCVLYVGQNQNDFTAPKVFSTPFSIAPAAGGTTTTTATTPSSTTTSTTPTATDPTGGNGTSTTTPTSGASSPVSPSVSLSSTTVSPSPTPAADTTALASTGAPADVEWIVGLGIGLLLSGSLGRRLIGGARR
jgi:hypothetical protein